VHKVVVITGGFDPIHGGHLSYIKAAHELGDVLVVGVNSDEWLARKKGQPFITFEERIAIIELLRLVDHAIPFDDSDGSGKDAIAWAKRSFPESQIIFANGGDRTFENIPEIDVSDVLFMFSVGGTTKANSSSRILEEWRAPKIKRDWGYYRVLHERKGVVKLKELTVEPGKSLIIQRHLKCYELWFVTEGTATLSISDTKEVANYNQFEYINIVKDSWHRLSNQTEKPLKISLIQYGEECVEEDIERKDNA
jgi:D-beta-D-heptose 7-phosphate kinase/D-beta-D-heptose 1-phosphate adenosyltransferase